MRLDVFLYERGLAASRQKAKQMIEAGAVSIGGKTILKPAFVVDEDADPVVAAEDVMQYVGRGGLKLEGALDYFHVDVNGLTALDVGASTGGFTQCLLMRGAVRVYAVDAGHGQLAAILRSDPRVISLEGVNARYMTPAVTGGERCGCAVMDVSFISQTMIYEALSRMLLPGAPFISLIKPQFEAGRQAVGKKGLIRDERVQQRTVETCLEAAASYGFKKIGVMDSPIAGGDGNREFLAYFIYDGNE